MKADLAIYSHAVDVSGQCISVSLILIVYNSFCNIKGIIYKGVGGWVGKPKADSDSGAVLSVDDRDVHNPHDGLRQPFGAVWQPTNSEYCFPVTPQTL